MIADIISIPRLLDDVDAAESATRRYKFQWHASQRMTQRIIPDRWPGYAPQGKRGSGEYNHHRRGLSLFHAL